MGTLLEMGRYALEGVEVLFAFGTVAALGAGLIWGHHVATEADETTTPRAHG